MEELLASVTASNIRRAAQGMKLLQIECLLILNDANLDAIEMLKENLAPPLAEIRANFPQLHITVRYLNDPFEVAYPKIRELLEKGRFRNALFNLDQCGHSSVHRETLVDILRSHQAVEISYTFSIASLLVFLRTDEPEALAAQLAHLDLSHRELKALEGTMSKQLGWVLPSGLSLVSSAIARRMLVHSRSTIPRAGGIGSSTSLIPTAAGRNTPASAVTARTCSGSGAGKGSIDPLASPLGNVRRMREGDSNSASCMKIFRETLKAPGSKAAWGDSLNKCCDSVAICASKACRSWLNTLKL